MFKLSGKSGDGIGAFGLKTHPDGSAEIAVIDSVMSDEPPLPRKAGLGGPAYTRHCLEAIVLERGMLWPPETVETALDLLDRIDGGGVSAARYETWIYAGDDSSVTRQSVRPFEPQPGTALQRRKFPEKEVDYDALLQGQAQRAEDELNRASLRGPWHERYATTLADFAKGRVATGQLLSSLLTRQAVAERSFLVNSVNSGTFDSDGFMELVSLRYVRALCQFELAANDPLRQPDLIELGRTILLLMATGHMNEARELAHRASARLGDEIFMPIVPLLGFACMLDRPDLIMDRPHGDFGTGLAAAAADYFRAIAAQNGAEVAQATAAIVDARRYQIASFSDEYVTDFDDDLSFAVPYEAAALCNFALSRGTEPSLVDHPAMRLPTGQFPDLSGRALRHVELHGVLLKAQRDARS